MRISGMLRLVAFVNLLAIEALSAQMSRGAFAVVNVRVFTGTEVLPSATVVVRDGIIAAFGSRITAPNDALEIDGRGLTLLPGLIDSHVLLDSTALETAARFGVTTEVDFGANRALVTQLRERSALHQNNTWAYFVTVGPAVDLQEDGTGDNRLPLRSLKDVQRMVDSLARAGNTFLNVVIEDALRSDSPAISGLTLLKPLVAAAHHRHLRVIAETRSLRRAREAISTGVDGLGQLFITDATDPGFGSHIGERRAFVISTLVALRVAAGREVGDSLVADSALTTFISPSMRQQILALRVDANPDLPYREASAGLRLIPGRGGTVLAGSGAGGIGVAHGVGLHRELELMVRAGLTPVQALTAATSAPAKVFGLKGRGRITLGAIADLVLVRGDPTTDIRATRSIVNVWRSGVRVDRTP